MNKKSIQESISILEEFISENKQQKIQEVLTNRSRYVTIVLEDIYQPHNASATIRTSDCLGVQDIHIIENRNPFSPSKQVMQGAGKWVSLHRYNDDLQEMSVANPENFPTHNTEKALQALKNQGYQLIATTPEIPKTIKSPKAPQALSDLNLKTPTAFLFGTEAHGLTQKALEMADGYLRLPMVGFTQSYNISVTVAITLAQTMQRLWKSDIAWQLSEKEASELKLEWYKRIVGIEKAKTILKHQNDS